MHDEVEGNQTCFVTHLHWAQDLLNECKLPYHVSLSHRRNHVSAFGFDPTTQDYKFVMARFNTHQKVFFQVYSLWKNSWKGFTQDFPYLFRTPLITGDGYLDGKFYWFSNDCSDEGNSGSISTAIVIFNFTTRTFEVNRLAKELACARDSVVVTTRGCLELITMSGEDPVKWCEIWVKRKLWSRTLSIDLSIFPAVKFPKGLTIKSQLIFESGAVTTCSCTILGHSLRGIWVFGFGESLFSPVSKRTNFIEDISWSLLRIPMLSPGE